MTGYAIKKSELSVEGYFHSPALTLLTSESNLHGTIVAFLSDHYIIQGDDIRINQDTNPLANANVTYDLRPFNGFARVSVDRAQLVLFSPHTLDVDTISGISLQLLNAVQKENKEEPYASFLVQIGLHVELRDIGPAVYTGRFVSTPKELESIIGHSVTYYLGEEGPRAHSAVTLDMSGEFSECIFVRVVLRFEGEKISTNELPEAAIKHYNELLAIVGLDPE